MSSIYDWSLEAAENAYADVNINWAEGQPPSSVNNSARVMMQRIKEYLLDNGGVMETQFTINEDKTSIRLITNSPIKAYMDGIVVRFKAQKQNRGITNIALKQLPMQPVYKITKSGIAPLKGQEIQIGGLYELVYICNIDGKNTDGWFLTNPVDKDNFPSGFIGTFAMEKLPDGWLVCDGKEYSRKEYADLFEALGETWGKGDGQTTFNVPDLRGMFLRGLDSGKGIDKKRSLGTKQEESFKAHTHEGTTERAGEHTHKYEVYTKSIDIIASTNGWEAMYNHPNKNKVWETRSAGAHEHKISLKKTGGDETRPVNVAVVYAVKA
ncbi:phage tail protein [Bartonella quintana]|uniref:35 kDa protein homolog n=2 Tax=Bartonella quintana TaxID=803 RepID=A0A0H3M3S7_BARQU|nr:phage tail protein [Bartonella quintana]ETS12151.1 hypothetical protein Q651_00892 [Bartonella quintana BQ2-D70]KEC58134.1 hypothetical protein O93_01213 [Bartonella quintana JK 19]KEC61028.1 hypothetical protein O91_00867 [Bartonella quintana JK 31]KEC64292.1 hypothetical protein O7Y_00049 [Bartonella quintana JK 63]KEC64744.1 hypothetical protein O7U_01216 [Bartonella quintana JK 68]